MKLLTSLKDSEPAGNTNLEMPEIAVKPWSANAAVLTTTGAAVRVNGASTLSRRYRIHAPGSHATGYASIVADLTTELEGES